MKKLLYISALIISFNALASPFNSRIPLMVRNYIKNTYPAATSIHYQKHENNFVAHLLNANREVVICLNEKGEVLDRVMELVSHDEIPVIIRDKIPMNKLVYSEKFEGKNGEFFFIVELKLPKHRIEEMVFDRDGNEIKEAVFKEKQAEDEGESVKVLEF
jgi:hypothetical protein